MQRTQNPRPLQEHFSLNRWENVTGNSADIAMVVLVFGCIYKLVFVLCILFCRMLLHWVIANLLWYSVRRRNAKAYKEILFPKDVAGSTRPSVKEVGSTFFFNNWRDFERFLWPLTTSGNELLRTRGRLKRFLTRH